jgi:SNF family Na+-dependent transporter
MASTGAASMVHHAGIPGSDRWASNNQFILAAAGSAIGLGNIMRFPSKAFLYGGGTFLIRKP